MKTLTNYTAKGGHHFTIIDRIGDIALAQSGGTVGFEVFEVQSHDGREIMGKYFPPAEYVPSNEQWGAKGWSFKTEAAARAKFDELANLESAKG